MADIKNFGLVGVGSTVQWGKAGPQIKQTSGAFNLRNAADSADANLTTGTLLSSGLITATKGSAVGITIGDVSTNSNSVLRMQGTSAGLNWQIANNLNFGGLEFTPSTLTGGTTYTTPVMTLASGAFAVTGTATVSGNIISTAGDITASAGNLALSATGATFTVGTDTTLSRAGAGVFRLNGTAAVMVPNGTTAQRPGTPAAAMVRFNSDNTALEFYNGTVWTTLSTSGATVTSFSAGTTGFTPSTDTSGAVTLSGTLNVANGGTGTTTSTGTGSVVLSTSPTLVTPALGTPSTAILTNATGLPLTTGVTGILPLANGGTNANLSASNGSIVYSTGSAMAMSSVGTTGQVLTSSGAGAPTWTTAASTVTTTQIVQGNGSGAFTANGATFVGSGSFSGVTLSGTVTNATDAVTKAYVDGVAAGLTWKTAVQAATTTNGTLATAFAAGQVVDSYTLVLGDRLLIKNQTAGTENGIYIVTAGTPVRSADMAVGTNADGDAMFVENGTVNANTGWVETANPAVVGTDALAFTQFSGTNTYSAGADLTLTGGVFSVNTGGTTASFAGPTNGRIGVNSNATNNNVLLSAGTGNEAVWGTVPLANTSAVSGTLAATNGGTGFATYTIGDTLYASTTTGLSKLGIGSTNQALVVAGGVPSWASIVNSAVAGTGISVSSATGAVTISNTGVLSITGTANQITASASTGSVTLSLPSTLIAPGSVEITSTLKIDTNTTKSFLYSDASGNVVSTSAPTNGQLLIGSTGNIPVAATLTAGSGITITNGAGSITISSAAGAGAIAAVSATVPLDANGTTNIGVALPAGATILQVKVMVTVADTAATLVIGKTGSTNAYMNSSENDPQTVGLYIAEDMVTEGSSVQVFATVASSGATSGASCVVFVTYQV